MILFNVTEIDGKYFAKMELMKTRDLDFNRNILCLVDNDTIVLGGYHFNSKYDGISVTTERDIISAQSWIDNDYEILPVHAVLTTNPIYKLPKLGPTAFDLFNDDMKTIYVQVDKIELGGGHVDYEFVLTTDNYIIINEELTRAQYETKNTYDGYEMSDDEKAAHHNYPYGSESPVGSQERTIYYQRKEAFLAGIEYYKKLMKK